MSTDASAMQLTACTIQGVCELCCKMQFEMSCGCTEAADVTVTRTTDWAARSDWASDGVL